jgi:hypothetical protein
MKMSDENMGTTHMETEGEVPTPAGHIREMSILDLRSAKTPEDLNGITGISEVGCILIPEHLTMALMRIPMHEVGVVAPIPQDANVVLQVGQIKLTGEALASGNADSILFIVGQLFLTTPVTSIGYKELRVTGQILAVRGSEAALGAKLRDFTGQTLYLPSKPRIIMGEETLGQAFLELLPEPESLVVMGVLTFDDDVTVDLLKSKITEIVLMGQIHAPKELVPLVQVITREKMGQIVSRE